MSTNYIYACTIKRDNDILIKGLSFDKVNWYLMPRELRLLRKHDELLKYIKLEDLLQCNKVDRSSQVRLTKAIRQIYCPNG